MKLSPPIQILIIDDSAVGRMGISAVLPLDLDIQIAAEAEDAAAALEKYRIHRPDVVLLGMPEEEGLDTLRNLLVVFPNARVLVLAIFERVDEMRRFREAGACGYMDKSAPRAKLIHSIKEIHSGRNRLCPPEPDANGHHMLLVE
ncbi:MAG: response regulator transcription factor [Luteolibacter sp.]